MKSCWKCRKAEKFMSPHHINGNPNDSRIFNLISLCKGCHDVVQAVCDKCDNQLNCYIKFFQECWLFDSGLPPIHFRKKVIPMEPPKRDPRGRKRLNKPTWNCVCMLHLLYSKLKIVCLLHKIRGMQRHPCVYRFDDGCTLKPEEKMTP